MMRRPQEVRVRPGSQKSQSTSLPAPIAGLNARDPVSNMRPNDAITLENWFPSTTSVDLRNGFVEWNTFTGVCQSILPYAGLTSTKVFPCVKSGSTYSIYDGTSTGPLSVAVVGGAGATVQALTSCRFDSVQFGTVGGAFLSVVNGADTALEYNGTAWSVASLTHASLSSTNKLFTNAVFAERMWFGEKDTFNVYYLPVQTKSGAMSRMNLGSLFKLGGYLNSIITLTDNSDGLADYIGFMSSEGEIIAFTGTDPSSAATWGQVAHFRVGRPVIKGSRAWCKWGTDALVLCADGVYPVRQAFATQNRDSGHAVSDRIRNLLNIDLKFHGTRYGWQLITHPTGSKLIVNVPTNEDVASYQYVMNTETRAWCKFTGWAAFCFSVVLDTLYFGGNGIMVKADTSSTDDGVEITGDAKQAFQYLAGRGRAAHLKMMRPILATDGAYSLGISADFDYKDASPSYLRPVSSGGGDPWGGIWDVEWSGATVVDTRWYGVPGIGHAMAPRLKVRSDGTEVSWSATDVVFEVGGILA